MRHFLVWWNVTSDLTEKSEEMTQILKNIEVTRNYIGEIMKDYAENNTSEWVSSNTDWQLKG